METNDRLAELLSPTLELDEQAKEQIRRDLWQQGMFHSPPSPESIIESFVRVGYCHEHVALFVWAEWEERQDAQVW